MEGGVVAGSWRAKGGQGRSERGLGSGGATKNKSREIWAVWRGVEVQGKGTDSIRI